MIAKKMERKQKNVKKITNFIAIIKPLLKDSILDGKRRILDIRATNCSMSHDIELSIAEISATQELNQMIKSRKTYHLLLSFPVGEKINLKQLEEMEETFCQELGFCNEHQRISIVHGDTDNLHIHIIINKLHSETYKIHSPYRDMITMRRICRKMEEKYNLMPNETSSSNQQEEHE